MMQVMFDCFLGLFALFAFPSSDSKRRNELHFLTSYSYSYYNCSPRAHTHTHAHKDIEPDNKFFADFSFVAVWFVERSFSLFAAAAATTTATATAIDHYLSLTIIYCFIHANLFNLCEFFSLFFCNFQLAIGIVDLKNNFKFPFC